MVIVHLLPSRTSFGQNYVLVRSESRCMTVSASKIRSEVSELSLLFEVSQLLDQSMDLRDVVHQVLKAMSKHTGMMRGTLALLQRGTGELVVEAAHGLTPD